MLVIEGWENTSLKPYVEMLDQHNVKILQATRERMSMFSSQPHILVRPNIYSGNTKGRDMNW